MSTTVSDMVIGGTLTVTGATSVTGALSSSAGVSGTTGTFSGAVSGTTGTFTGAVSGTTGTFSAAVSGTTGTFTGAVSGTTGTFSGDLSAPGGFRHTYKFVQADCTASQSAVALLASGCAALTGIPMIRAGSVVGIGITCESARSAGTCTVDATIGGTATGLQAVLNGTNTTTAVATQAKDTDAFSAAGLLGVKITTDGDWAAGTTPEILVCVEVEF